MAHLSIRLPESLIEELTEMAQYSEPEPRQRD